MHAKDRKSEPLFAPKDIPNLNKKEPADPNYCGT